MIFSYLDERVMVVSRHEIQRPADSPFLWHCYRKFRAMFIPRRDDNLIMVWESDFKELWEKANKE
jgi:hypothetical protein